MSLELALKALVAEVLAEAGVIKSASVVPGAVAPDGSTPNTTTPPVAQKRGRGRPVKGEEIAAPAASAEPVSEADPFESTPAVALNPQATLDEVKGALTALRAATTQENAVAVMSKATGGCTTLSGPTGVKPEQYGLVVAAAKAAMPAAPAADPFDAPAPVSGAIAPKALTIEDVKNEVVQAQKRTSQDTVQKIVMKHGGKAPKPEGGEGPSLKALPESAFAAVVEELKALPSTK